MPLPQVSTLPKLITATAWHCIDKSVVLLAVSLSKDFVMSPFCPLPHHHDSRQIQVNQSVRKFDLSNNSKADML